MAEVITIKIGSKCEYRFDMGKVDGERKQYTNKVRPAKIGA